jgi:hypothetical protein
VEASLSALEGKFSVRGEEVTEIAMEIFEKALSE